MCCQTKPTVICDLCTRKIYACVPRNHHQYERSSSSEGLSMNDNDSNRTTLLSLSQVLFNLYKVVLWIGLIDFMIRQNENSLNLCLFFAKNCSCSGLLSPKTGSLPFPPNGARERQQAQNPTFALSTRTDSSRSPSHVVLFVLSASSTVAAAAAAAVAIACVQTGQWRDERKNERTYDNLRAQ